MIELPEVEVNADKPANLDELRRDVRKLMAWSQLIHEQNKAIKRRLTWMAVGSYIRLALILAPLILAAIYVPPLIRQGIDTYNSIKSGQFISSSTMWSGTGISVEQAQKLLRQKFQ